MSGQKPVAVPGHPIPRRKPYVWATAIAKALGADTPCLWAGWFKSHFQHFKVERDAENLPIWNAEHAELMRRKVAEMKRAGFACAVEDENKFTLNGQTADVAGKPDLVASLGDQVVVVDGKTGRERDADVWQVKFYIYALQLARPALGQKDVVGLVHYKSGRDRRVEAPTGAEIDRIVNVIRVFGADAAPDRTPSEWQCGRCDIHLTDCPKRWQESQRLTAATARF